MFSILDPPKAAHTPYGTDALDQPVSLESVKNSVQKVAPFVLARGAIRSCALQLRVAYGTSKAGLMHLTKQQAAELGSVGIRVNAVAPGPVDTAMAKAVHSPEIRSGYHDAIPLARYGSEEEIAEAIWFLCSDAASYINGQILGVDGGFDATGIGLADLRDQSG